MRFFEILLSIANIIALPALLFSRIGRWRWLGYTALLAGATAITQLVIEGPRWQMIPAYLLSVIYFLVWLLRWVRPRAWQVNRILRGVGVGFSTLILAASIATPITLPVFHFRKPTGPYAIGTTTYHWVDTSRPELFTADPKDHRELMAQIWYPAKKGASGTPARYLPDAEAWAPAAARLMRVPRFLFRHFRYVTTNAVASAPLAPDHPRYPVLIFSSGLGGFRAVNTFQIEELVSHGYIVVGLDQPGAVALVRFPDGRQISVLPRDEINRLIDQSVEQQPRAPELSATALPDGIIPYFGQDISFTVDQLIALDKYDRHHILNGRLDLDRVGAFGISLGGMNVAEACSLDARLKACLIMDVSLSSAVVQRGLRQPTMFMTRDAATMRLERQRSGGWTEKDIALTLGTMRAAYDSLPGDGYYVEIPKMFHINFTDAPYWSPFMARFGLIGPIDKTRGFDITNAYSRAFFDHALRNQSAPLLSGPSRGYPEVNFKTRSTPTRQPAINSRARLGSPLDLVDDRPSQDS